MRKLNCWFAIAGLAALGVHGAFAADLIVEENGVLPNFATIQSAIDAADPDDRIHIRNREFEPYLGDVTIDKPLTLLALESNGFFEVAGAFTIVPDPAAFSPGNKGVRIVGMRNLSGAITATANNTNGNPIVVDVHGSMCSSITLSGLGYAARISGNVVGSITAREAHVIGNQVTGAITLNDAAATAVLGDTLFVVGNRMATTNGGPVNAVLTWANGGHHYCHIANNWIRSSSSSGLGLINLASLREGGKTNLILNNTVASALNASSVHGIRVANGLSNAQVRVENNILKDEFLSDSGGAEIAITVGLLPLADVKYNLQEGFKDGLLSGAVQSEFQNLSVPSGTVVIDSVTGGSTSELVVNLGNPADHDLDLDGTRNDRGVMGGSFHPDNFWPILTGSARVFLANVPRTVTEGGTIDIEAVGYDR